MFLLMQVGIQSEMRYHILPLFHQQDMAYLVYRIIYFQILYLCTTNAFKDYVVLTISNEGNVFYVLISIPKEV